MAEIDNEIENTHRSRTARSDRPKMEEIFAQRAKALREDFAYVAGTPQGRNVFTHIMRICGYQNGQVGGNPSLGMDVMTGTLYNCARESIYQEIKELIPKAVRRDIEFRASDEIE